MGEPDDRGHETGGSDSADADPPRAESGDPGSTNAEPTVAIERPDVDEVEVLAELWVALAADQRAHGSHVLPGANRAHVRDTLARHAVTGGVQVARADDEVVGFVTYGPEQGAYDQDATRGVVRNLYVRPDHRNRGVGRRLLAAAEAALRGSGATVVALETMADNGRAREFYREQGYEPHRIEFEKRVDDAAEGTAGDGSERAADPDADGA